MKQHFNLLPNGIAPKKLYRNLSPAQLYAKAIRYDKGAVISDKGALVLLSGEKTGRSPKDKRIVEDTASKQDMWLVKLNLYTQIYLKYRLKKRGFGICKAMFGNNFGNKKSPYISVRALSSAPPLGLEPRTL